jgi:glycosyltransferase involved in cell wall biosynthesis
MICSVGLERRDYVTLMRAVDGLDVDVVIAAASPWSKQPDSTADSAIPSNVTVRSFDQSELREVYAASAFSVMPLHDVDFQAGITAILESMAMARPVVCTRTRGQTDTLVDDVTGRYVAVGNSVELRTVIEELLGDRKLLERMGAAARRWVVEHAEVDVYATRLGSVVNENAPPG